jgi:hypothetical protein
MIGGFASFKPFGEESEQVCGGVWEVKEVGNSYRSPPKFKQQSSSSSTTKICGSKSVKNGHSCPFPGHSHDNIKK